LGEKRRERYKAATPTPANRPSPSFQPQPQPQSFTNSSIDTSSFLNPFKETTEGDVRMPSYQSKLEATLARGLHAQLQLNAPQPPLQPQQSQLQQQQQNPFL